jgi:hypothetical protein
MDGLTSFAMDGFTSFAKDARAILDADRNLFPSWALRQIFRRRSIAPIE